MDNLRNCPTRNEALILTILLKHVAKCAIQQSIFILKGVLLALIMGIFSDRFFNNLAGLLMVVCLGLITYVIIAEYQKSHRINSDLRAVLDQSERMDCDHDDVFFH